MPWLDDFEEVFHRAELVAADLAGELAQDALAPEIAARGWGGCRAWGGEPWIVEEPAASDAPAAVEAP